MTAYIGIDPGFKGAIAIIAEEGEVKIIDSPTLMVGTKKEHHVPEMMRILAPYIFDTVAAIEKVHSMPKQGVASAFTFGKGYGLWLGLLAAMGIPHEEVTPQKWQGAMMDGMKRGKDAARLRAMQLFPQLSEQLKYKVNDGRADALLIAEFRRRQG